MGRRPGHGDAFTDGGLRPARRRRPGNGFPLSPGKVARIRSHGSTAAAGPVTAGQPPAAIASPRLSLAAAERPPRLPGPRARQLTGTAHGWWLKSPPPGGAVPTWELPGDSAPGDIADCHTTPLSRGRRVSETTRPQSVSAPRWAWHHADPALHRQTGPGAPPDCQGASDS